MPLPPGPKKPAKKRRRYTDKERARAVALAKKKGVPMAAKLLGIGKSQIYGWRKKAGRSPGRPSTRRASAAVARVNQELALNQELEKLRGRLRDEGVVRLVLDTRAGTVELHRAETLHV